MINEDKVIISNGINIGATIAYKDKNKKRPLVLLIMGTGTTDRDGNSFGFKTNLHGRIWNVVHVYLVLIDVLKELLVKELCLLRMNIITINM